MDGTQPGGLFLHHIVGEYLGAADSTFHPFLGTPTPEPASIVSATIGLALAGSVARPRMSRR